MDQNSPLQTEASTLSQEAFLQDASKDSHKYILSGPKICKESYIKHTWTKRNVPELRIPNVTVTAECPAETGNSENETFASKQ